jgi:ankyrin repeat protein
MDGYMALHLAAKGGHETITQLFLTVGANLESEATMGILHHVVENGHAAIIKLILEASDR